MVNRQRQRAGVWLLFRPPTSGPRANPLPKKVPDSLATQETFVLVCERSRRAGTAQKTNGAILWRFAKGELCAESASRIAKPASRSPQPATRNSPPPQQRRLATGSETKKTAPPHPRRHSTFIGTSDPLAFLGICNRTLRLFFLLFLPCVVTRSDSKSLNAEHAGAAGGCSVTAVSTYRPPRLVFPPPYRNRRRCGRLWCRSRPLPPVEMHHKRRGSNRGVQHPPAAEQILAAERFPTTRLCLSPTRGKSPCKEVVFAAGYGQDNAPFVARCRGERG